MYVKVGNDGVPQLYSLTQLRKDNPNVSFPVVFNDDILAPFNVFPVSVLPKPSYDDATEKLVAREPQEINGAWILAYDVVAMSPEEVADKLAQKRAQMSCTPRQARLALSKSGKYGAVKAFMAQLPAEQKEEADIEWEYATQFERTSGLLVTLTAAMGMTEQEVDDLFDLAQTL